MKIILTLILLFIFCDAKEVQLQLKWQHQFQFAGYYAALYKGYYKDVGLDVTIKEASPSMNMSDEILQKRAHFGVGTSSLVLDFAQNKPVVVLGVIFQHSPLALISLKENMQTIHDLVEKKIMIEDGSADIYALLKREKIDQQSLQILEHTFNTDALIDKKIDAMSIYSIDEPFLLQQKNLRYTMFSPREAGIDFYGDNLFTSQEFLNQNKETVDAFLSASIKGWQYALKHQDEIIDLIMEHFNTQNKSREHYEFEAKYMLELIYPDILEIGYMHKGRWEHIVSVYKELGFLDANINLDEFLYNPEKTFLDRHKNIVLLISFFSFILLVISTIASYIYKTNQKLLKSEQRHKILFKNSASAGIVWKKGYIITDWNEQATRLFGWSKKEVLGKNFFEFLIPHEMAGEVKRNIDKISENTNLHIFTNKNLLKNQSIIVCEWHNTLLPKKENEDDFEIISLAIDITQREEDEQILKLQANNDFLTTLPNRLFFETILEKTYALAKRDQSSFGVALIDLDGFKKINDTYGHSAGDILLKELAKRFQTTTRQEDTIARLGGDEFALIFHMSDDEESYIKMLERLLENANTPVKYMQDTELKVSASIGVSFYSISNQVSLKLLISQADEAMYAAKREGKNCFFIYKKTQNS